MLVHLFITMKKSIYISVEENNIKLRNRGISMYARLDTRRINTIGKYPIRIRVILKGIVRDYGTKQYASEEEFKRIAGKRPKGTDEDMKLIIIELLKRAFNIVQEIDPFSFEIFNEMYFDKRNNNISNVYNWYTDKIKQLKENGQLGTALTYENSRDSISKFKTQARYIDNDSLLFSDIDVQFLKNYEKWIYAKEMSPTTVGIYLRNLRHLFNLARNHSSNFVKHYPFDEYQIPSPKNIKKALTGAEMKLIYEYKASEGTPEKFYMDIWLFSYFGNGISIKDICRLKYKNIIGDKIEFRRAKTARTKKNIMPICIVIKEDLKRIINEHGTKSKNKNDHIFNFLHEGMTDEQEMATVKKLTKQVNIYIKRIAKELEIDKNVSSYTARHTFATILKNAGVTPSFIGESLGHSSLSTTESYLGSFEDEQRKKILEKLKDW